MTVHRRGTSTYYYRRPWRSYYRRPYYRRYNTFNDRLTGGSLDVNPQLFKGSAALTAADTQTEISFQLPVTRIPTANKVTIIEVLRFTVEFPPFNAANTGVQEQKVAFLTSAFGTAGDPTVSSSNIICKFERGSEKYAGAGGYAISSMQTQSQDLTDGAGHGLLVASDKLYVNCKSVNDTPTVDAFYFSMEYRFKTVGIREYAGIVQSQQ